MKPKNYLGLTSIDSLKLSFNIDEVDIIDSKLLDHKITQVVNTITGEIEQEKPIQLNSIKHQYEEYQIHFAINKLFGEERVVVLINSKLLESDYMNGVSMKNIELVYNRLMEANIFHISFYDFLSKGMVSDIDIKKDVEFSSTEEFDKMTKVLDNSTIAQRRKDKGSNRFAEKENKGIEWNSRTKSSHAHPFLKIYHKGIESKHSKNYEFFNRYLELDSINNVVRVEATIKNFSTQGAKYGFVDNSLQSLLNKSSIELNEIIDHSVLSNLERRIKDAKPKTLKEYSPTDMILFQSLSLHIQNHHSIDQVISYLIKPLESVAKSRMKKKLLAIYESEIKGEIAEIKSRNISGFFNSIGWK